MFIEKPYKPFTDPEGGRRSTITPYDHLRGRGIFLKIILLTCDPFWVIYKNAAIFWVERENFELKEQSAELNLTLNNDITRALATEQSGKRTIAAVK